MPFSRAHTTHFAVVRKTDVRWLDAYRTLCGISTRELALSEFVTTVRFAGAVSCNTCQAELVDRLLQPPAIGDALP